MKPILFNTEMVRAILGNHKTVTRRVVRPHYRNGEAGLRVVTNKHTGQYVRIEIFDEWEDETRWLNEPYRPGDILYVRETWQHGFGGAYLYKASAGYDLFMTPEGKLVSDIPWRPSIHMPREAARIFLRVTNVYPQQLKDVTEADARAEGFNLRDEFMSAILKMYPDCTEDSWFWANEFERISREEAGPLSKLRAVNISPKLMCWPAVAENVSARIGSGAG